MISGSNGVCRPPTLKPPLRERYIGTPPSQCRLSPAARELSPTLTELSALAPDLRALFRDLGPLMDAAERGFPAAERVLEDLRVSMAGAGAAGKSASTAASSS